MAQSKSTHILKIVERRCATCSQRMGDNPVNRNIYGDVDYPYCPWQSRRTGDAELCDHYIMPECLMWDNDGCSLN